MPQFYLVAVTLKIRLKAFFDNVILVLMTHHFETRFFIFIIKKHTFV